MDNLFITRDFDWQIKRSSHLDRALNLILRRLGLSSSTTRSVDTAGFVDKTIRQVSGISFPAYRSGISTSIEQRINMYHLISQVIAYNIPGDVVEVGCNTGQSAVLFRKVLDSYQSGKQLHVYDSFEGLPEAGGRDGSAYGAGDLATSEDVLRANFKTHGLNPPIIHKGWFKDTLPTGLPASICFAHLDGDLYDSIKVSLEHVYPRLSAGAVCLIDDYCDPQINPDGWNYLPGVKAACDEYLKDKRERIEYLYSGTFTHGFFRKL